MECAVARRTSIEKHGAEVIGSVPENAAREHMPLTFAEITREQIEQEAEQLEARRGPDVAAQFLNFALGEGLTVAEAMCRWMAAIKGAILGQTLEGHNAALGELEGLRSFADPVDTTTAAGELVFNIFASLSQYEKELLPERTLAGSESARARGRKGGRKPKLTAKALREIKALMQHAAIMCADIAKRFGIAPRADPRRLISRDPRRYGVGAGE